MNYKSALATLYDLRRSNHPIQVDFVSPLLAAMLGVECQRDASASSRLVFSDKARGYAHRFGLISAIEGRTSEAPVSGLEGETFARLSRIGSAGDVDASNRTIADVLFAQLGDSRFSRDVVHVVGELHDNIASHARGAGFSAAQLYKRASGSSIEIAVVDGGCGLLANVRRVVSSIRTDAEAIQWCLEPGHTTAAAHDDWAQALPPDAYGNPLGPGVPVRYDRAAENSHTGYGLHLLEKLVKETRGTLWLCTGAGQILINAAGQRRSVPASLAWNGFAVECTIPEQSLIDEDPEGEEMSRWARRIGI